MYVYKAEHCFNYIVAHFMRLCCQFDGFQNMVNARRYLELEE